MKRLLDTKKIDLNLPNAHGQNPLSLALEQRDKAMIKLLLKTCKTDAFSGVLLFRQTPLEYAAKIAAEVANAGFSGSEEVLEDYASGDEVEDDNLRQIEYIATWINEYDILRLLRTYNLKVAGLRHWRPFLLAVWQEIEDIVSSNMLVAIKMVKLIHGENLGENSKQHDS